MLYVTGGDGASFNFADYGQGGGSAGSPTRRTRAATRRAVRAWPRRRRPPKAAPPQPEPPPAGQRAGAPERRAPPRRPRNGRGGGGQPTRLSTDANARRIIAYGMRNPFRFTFRPGTSELWIGDVGWNDWEEIERRVAPTGGVENFGWPCYEGTGPQPGYQSAGLNSCTSLYSAGTAVAPYYTYSHSNAVVAGDNCPTANGSVISALAFYNGGTYRRRTTARSSSATTRATASGRCMPGATGCPTRRRSSSSSAAQRTRSTSSRGRGATYSTSISTAARSTGSRTRAR